MSETMKAGRGRAGSFRLPLLLLMLSMAGCASVTEDVDKYYRQMELQLQRSPGQGGEANRLARARSRACWPRQET